MAAGVGLTSAWLTQRLVIPLLDAPSVPQNTTQLPGEVGLAASLKKSSLDRLHCTDTFIAAEHVDAF